MIRCLFCGAPRGKPCDVSQHPEWVKTPLPFNPAPHPRVWLAEHGATPETPRARRFVFRVEDGEGRQLL